jgi:hypothetical protein
MNCPFSFARFGPAWFLGAVLTTLTSLAADSPPQTAPAVAAELSTHPVRASGTAPALSASAPGPRRAFPLAAQAAGTLQLYNHGDPTPQEQYMLELVNRARLDPAAEAARYGIDLNEGLAPNTLSSTPKEPLAFNPSLIQSARLHSQWMLDNDVFSHYEGTIDPGDRMEAAGFVFSGSWTYGENLAWRGTTGTLDLNPSVAASHEGLFVDAGIDDRGHRLNLMNNDFCEVGIGVKTGVFTASGKNYNAGMITQDFGSTEAHPDSFLVGVVYQDLDGNGFYSPGEGLAGITVTPASGSYYAVTSSSGGYAIPLNAYSGTFSVTLTGGSLTGPITKSVKLNGYNVKLDFDTTKDKPAVSRVSLTSPRRLANGTFTFNLQGGSGASITVQGSTNLLQWIDLGTATGTNFTDTTAASLRGRFYRAVVK